jgi:hypothetical protein
MLLNFQYVFDCALFNMSNVVSMLCNLMGM